MISAGLKWLFAVCLGIPLLLIGLSAWMSYDALMATRGTAQWVVHTFEVKGRLQDILTDLVTVETSERGYMLTHQKAFLEPFAAAMPRIPRELAELPALLAARPLLHENMARLQALATDKLVFDRANVALEEAGRHDDAIAKINSGYGQLTMNAIRQVVDDMDREEDRLLAEREAAFRRQMSRNNAIMAGIVAVQLLLTAGGGILLWWFARLRSYATVCAWSKTIQHEGKWITFEEYLARRFGLQITHGINPTEARKIMDQVHAQTTAQPGPNQG